MAKIRKIKKFELSKYHIIATCLIFGLAGGLLVLATLAFSETYLPINKDQSTIASARRIKSLPIPSIITARDGGGSVRLGKDILWLYGDTFYKYKFNPRPADAHIWRTATATKSKPDKPFDNHKLVADNNGNPKQIIPFNSVEMNYNLQKNNVRDRYIIWPSGQVPAAKDKAHIYFQVFKTGSTEINKNIGTGIATITDKQTVATRRSDLLFKNGETNFRKALVKDDHIYLYGVSCPNKECPVARVSVRSATKRSAYSFWDGKTWNKDIKKAKPVIKVSSYGYDVMWSKYLNKYVHVMIGELSHDVYFSYAKNPQGPWTAPKKAFQVIGKVTYVPYLHQDIRNDNRIYMTYSRDDSAICKSPCTDKGGIDVVIVKLRK